MSFFGSLLGSDQKDAAQQAADDTYKKQWNAIQGITDYGNTLPGIYRAMYQPYADTGVAANSALARLFTDPSSVSSLPGYQFDLTQGINGLDRSAAARGMLNSGSHDKSVLNYATGLADNTLGSQLQRLMSGTTLGLAGNAGVGQGIQDQLSTRNTAYNGQMQSAGTIGQGMIAGANAEGQGALNIANLIANGVGRIAGGGGGFNLSNLFSRGSSYGGDGPSF